MTFPPSDIGTVRSPLPRSPAAFVSPIPRTSPPAASSPHPAEHPTVLVPPVQEAAATLAPARGTAMPQRGSVPPGWPQLAPALQVPSSACATRPIHPPTPHRPCATVHPLRRTRNPIARAGARPPSGTPACTSRAVAAPHPQAL